MSSDKLKRTQEQIEEVESQVKTNIENILERSSKLKTLDQKANSLEMDAHQFNTRAQKVKRKKCIENYRWWAIGIIVLTILILIIVSAAGGFD